MLSLVACQKQAPQETCVTIAPTAANITLIISQLLNDSMQSGFTAYAHFAAARQDANADNSYKNVGTVLLDGIAMDQYYNNNDTMYNFEGQYLMASSATWEVEGGNGFPAFTHTTENQMPFFGARLEKSTINRNESLELHLSGIKEAHELTIIVMTSTQKMHSVRLEQPIALNSTHVFPASEIATALTGSEPINISVIAQSKGCTIIEGKKVETTMMSYRSLVGRIAP
jgi:hypothetical protein